MSFITAKLVDIKNSPFRIDDVYRFDQDKVDSLKESIETTSFWENLLARKTKAGVIQLAYGHHRLEALRQLVKEGLVDYSEIKINVRPATQLTDEKMLKILVQENKDDWRDIPENLCMSLLQVKAHLHNILASCKDVGEFMSRMGTSAPALKMDARSFTRAKNAGVGASMITQFLGNTWSRQTIQDALQLIEAGENSEELRKLAETLPNVTLAHRFSKLMVKEPGEGGADPEMFTPEVMTKAAKKLVANNLTRADVEQAIQLTGQQDDDKKDPVAALDAVVKAKKEALKKAAEAAKSSAPPKRTPLDRIQVAFDSVKELMEKLAVELDEDALTAIGSRIDDLQDLLTDIAEREPEPTPETPPAPTKGKKTKK